jgi:hypothetical protein
MIGMRLKSEIAQQTLSDRNASYAACLVCGMLRMRHAWYAACFVCGMLRMLGGDGGYPIRRMYIRRSQLIRNSRVGSSQNSHHRRLGQERGA